MAATLASGSPIICSMGPGIFTSSGHFIVLTGYQDGSFTVHDPASKMRSSKTYTFDEFSDQIKNSLTHFYAVQKNLWGSIFYMYFQSDSQIIQHCFFAG